MNHISLKKAYMLSKSLTAQDTFQPMHEQNIALQYIVHSRVGFVYISFINFL